jgi:type IV pilus assembly protein PilW
MSVRGRKPRGCCLAPGIGLIELLVALVIGLVLILGAVTIYSQSRRTYRTFETVARLQETARYAFDLIEADARMASYWGLLSRPDAIANRAGPAQAMPAELAAASATIAACGSNWAIDLDQYVAGWNGRDGFGLVCDAHQDAYRPGTDGLIVRRGAPAAPESLVGRRLYLQSTPIEGTLFVADGDCSNPNDPACVPAAYPPLTAETRELSSTAYYLSDVSVGGADVPALRRKRLAAGSMLDEELISGIEDLQIRFGVDQNGDANADIYADPQADPAAYAGAIVAVTIWLRVRAEEPEIGFTDDRQYRYADVDDPAPNDGFRRIVVSRTVSLNNTRR